MQPKKQMRVVHRDGKTSKPSGGRLSMYRPLSRGKPQVLRRSPKRRVEEIEIGDPGSASGNAQNKA